MVSLTQTMKSKFIHLDFKLLYHVGCFDISALKLLAASESFCDTSEIYS